MNKLKKLRKNNNILDGKLTSDNGVIMTNLVCYLRSSDIYDEQIEEIRQDLLYMFLDAQEHDEDIHIRIGEDIKLFCDDIIHNAPQKTRFEKYIEHFEIICYALFILGVILLICNINYTNLFTKGFFQTTIEIPLFTMIIFLSFLPISYFIVYYITKKALSEEKKWSMKKRLVTAFSCALIAGILAYLSIALRLTSFVALSLSMYSTILCILFLTYFILHKTSDYLHQKHITMTKTLS